jgi:hypothetical protein
MKVLQSQDPLALSLSPAKPGERGQDFVIVELGVNKKALPKSGGLLGIASTTHFFASSASIAFASVSDSGATFDS